MFESKPDGRHCTSSSSSSSGSDSESEDLFGDKEDELQNPKEPVRSDTSGATQEPVRSDVSSQTKAPVQRTTTPAPKRTNASRSFRETPQSSIKTSQVEKEKYSGLQIANRCVGAQRFDDMMKGKKTCSVDRLDRLSKSKDNENWVVVSLMYERSLSQLSKKGDRYVRWLFTDLSYPKSNQFILYLFEEAYLAWEEEGADNARVGSIFAVLNPMPMSEEKRTKADERAVLKVSHASQVVKLGQCPSLIFCTAYKKDGIHCTMPCDKEKGNVCFYHAQSKAAAQVKAWGAAKKGKVAPQKGSILNRENAQSNVQNVHPSPSDQLYVLPCRLVATGGYPSAPLSQTRGGPKRKDEGTAAALRLLASASKPRGSPNAFLTPVHPPKINAPSTTQSTGRKQTEDPSSASKDAKIVRGGEGGESVSRLDAKQGLSGSLKGSPGGASASWPDAKQGFSGSLKGTPGLMSHESTISKKATDELLSRTHTGPRPVDQPRPPLAPLSSPGASGLVAQLRSRFPNGISAPNPNWGSYESKQQSSESKQQSRSSASDLTPVLKPSTHQASRNRSRSAADLRSVTDVQSRATPRLRPANDPHGAPYSTSHEERSHVVAKSQHPAGGFDLSLHGVHAREERAEKMRQEKASKSKLAALYGGRVAAQLMACDPTKDLVRWKKAQASEIVEQEQILKRDRELSEMQFRDDMTAKMEALMSLEVPAWRCKECSWLSESASLRQDCQKKGHTVSSCTAKKTKWVCSGCKCDTAVLDRDLPEHCKTCGREANFRQVPFQRPRTAVMEKDKLLPRGEEIKFLNSMGPPPKGATKNAPECEYEKAFGSATND
eukprot:gnl/MRDRNA2_/MRDRNA2_75649_c0_seq1.p1 gnl/MRDRNA2_/MRDRNA2_75649_c0~~gnl/MRDRNA2_/MRDRNA2_75649_c0_seq1.p1  ORF type:complete len:832 (+),score=133.62 gnl/MRDRNA2_/MRDRNA2_75649_c0_seq1:138-2633(+)